MIKVITSLTLRILIGYGILVLVHWMLSTVSNIDALGILVAAPFLAVYLFSNMGIPGLLEHGGRCGWGWCEPTLFGYLFLVLFWFGCIVLFAMFWSRIKRSEDPER